MGNLNLGIIGAGFMGKPYSVALQMAKRFFGEKMHDVSFRVLATTQENTGRALAKNLGIEEWTGDWRSLMKREDIHAVIIASPNYLHREMVLEAARHGKHLMCEKPLALSVSEAKEMNEAVEKAGVKHMINFNYRKTPAMMKACF